MSQSFVKSVQAIGKNCNIKKCAFFNKETLKIQFNYNVIFISSLKWHMLMECVNMNIIRKWLMINFIVYMKLDGPSFPSSYAQIKPSLPDLSCDIINHYIVDVRKYMYSVITGILVLLQAYSIPLQIQYTPNLCILLHRFIFIYII